MGLAWNYGGFRDVLSFDAAVATRIQISLDCWHSFWELRTFLSLAAVWKDICCPEMKHNQSRKTSSSAVAKRPRDASCLSVVSFTSTKRRVESFIVSYVGYRFVTACSFMRCSVFFGVTLRLPVINISSSSPAINTATYYQRRAITCDTVAVVHRGPCWQHLPVSGLTAQQWKSQI